MSHTYAPPQLLEPTSDELFPPSLEKPRVYNAGETIAAERECTQFLTLCPRYLNLEIIARVSIIKRCDVDAPKFVITKRVVPEVGWINDDHEVM